ncbi:MAG TPA: hypothetical protein VGO00_07430 [Kofleriaceae bacterium]|nr:hypothetical protein [Kofleriaceae bacterium]
MQRGLEALYRIDTGVDVDDYMIDEAARDGFAPARRPREQLLVSHGDSELSVALFIAPDVLATLHTHDPSHGLGDHNLGDFLLAVEGVSHFIYTVSCAKVDRRVSQLELELQAEVDKYVSCLLATDTDAGTSARLRRKLFRELAYDADLDRDERDRYVIANDNADRYAAWLEDTYVAPRRIPEMLAELREFYRRGLADKLARCA